MTYQVRIECDSVNTSGDRLTSWVLTYPRFVHAELMTHRLFSRNSSSSRAIPVEKLIKQTFDDPALPVYWGKNQKGMQADEELSEELQGMATRTWLSARDRAVDAARDLLAIGVHKQITNRLLEPWMWITVIVSATEFENWFALRDHKDAQPEIREVAARMFSFYKSSEPRLMRTGSWHLPFIAQEDRYVAADYWPEADHLDILKKVSVGRCARVSYLTHDGKRDLREDVNLHDRLAATDSSGDPGHYSPFEHQAYALNSSERWGNFIGWRQYRKQFKHEHRGRNIECLQRGN